MKEREARQSNFFDVCNQCHTNYGCCHDTTPPVTNERRKIIEAYLGIERIRVDRPFVEGDYVYPRLKADGYCVFHDYGTKKCLVHSVKPETCVAGPITFDINPRTGKIEWFVKKESLCQLAKVVFDDKRFLEKHIASAKKEIMRLVDQLDSTALKAILRKDEPETFKISEDTVEKKILEKVA
jgi:Fe-S-cluster containining protein